MNTCTCLKPAKVGTAADPLDDLCQALDVAKTDVTISFAVTNSCLEGGLQYAADAFEPATAEAMACYLQVILWGSCLEHQTMFSQVANAKQHHSQYWSLPPSCKRVGIARAGLSAKPCLCRSVVQGCPQLWLLRLSLGNLQACHVFNSGEDFRLDDLQILLEMLICSTGLCFAVGAERSKGAFILWCRVTLCHVLIAFPRRWCPVMTGHHGHAGPPARDAAGANSKFAAAAEQVSPARHSTCCALQRIS